MHFTTFVLRAALQCALQAHTGTQAGSHFKSMPTSQVWRG